MASLTGTYDPNAEASQDFGAIPSGEYTAIIVDSDMKPTKQNDGHYLELAYQVSEGEFKGRKVWTRLNLDSPNATAVEIANREFASIREATGVKNPTDSTQLHNRPHIIRVEFIPAGTVQRNYTTKKDGNEIKAWKKIEGAAPAPAASNDAKPAAGASPWSRAA